MNGEIKITTRCPSCHNQTLSINKQGHLFCTWLECKNPALIHLAAEPEFGPFVIQPPSKELMDMLNQCAVGAIIRSLDCIATDSCKATTEQIKP